MLPLHLNHIVLTQSNIQIDSIKRRLYLDVENYLHEKLFDDSRSPYDNTLRDYRLYKRFPPSERINTAL